MADPRRSSPSTPTRASSSAPTSGATHVLVALTDLRGRVVAEKAFEIDISAGPEVVLDRVARTGRALLSGAGRSRDELAGVGIGLPGPVEHSTGRPVLPPIMPGWDNYDVPAHLSTALGGPVLVDNDVNLMALGEHATMYPHVEQMIFVKVATGIGAGIISGGRLHRGAQGAAGDLGHVAALHGDGIPCTCGNVGCLEAVASGPAVVRALLAHGIDAGDTRGLVRLAKSGDLAAATAVREAGREIGHVLATCVSLLNPSVIAVGGLLAQAAESLLAGIREVVYGRSLPLATGRAADRGVPDRRARGRHRRRDDGHPARALGRAGRGADLLRRRRLTPPRWFEVKPDRGEVSFHLDPSGARGGAAGAAVSVPARSSPARLRLPASPCHPP